MTRLQSTWNPLREFNRLRDRFRQNSSFPFTFPTFELRESPAVNVWQGDGQLIVKTEIPGVEPEAVDVSVTPDTLTIKLNRPETELQDGEALPLQERPSGREERKMELPFAVDPDRTDAVYENGVLTLTLHQSESQKPKKVAIKAG